MLSYKDNRYDNQEVFVPLLCFLELEAALTVLSYYYSLPLHCLKLVLTSLLLYFLSFRGSFLHSVTMISKSTVGGG